MDEKLVYVVFKDSSIFGVYDEEKWEDFNTHFEEKSVINRFNVYRCEINGECSKIYWNVHREKWEKDW